MLRKLGEIYNFFGKWGKFNMHHWLKGDGRPPVPENFVRRNRARSLHSNCLVLNSIVSYSVVCFKGYAEDVPYKRDGRAGPDNDQDDGSAEVWHGRCHS